MFKIKTMNSISEYGINELLKRGCDVSPDFDKPDGILVRSAELHDYEFNPELLAIARAGAGYNKIPVEKCAELGIVVFNSPGANAEAVKEQEIASMVMASRDILGSIEWVRSIADRGEINCCFFSPSRVSRKRAKAKFAAFAAKVSSISASPVTARVYPAESSLADALTHPVLTRSMAVASNIQRIGIKIFFINLPPYSAPMEKTPKSTA